MNSQHNAKDVMRDIWIALQIVRANVLNCAIRWAGRIATGVVYGRISRAGMISLVGSARHLCGGQGRSTGRLCSEGENRHRIMQRSSIEWISRSRNRRRAQLDAVTYDQSICRH